MNRTGSRPPSTPPATVPSTSCFFCQRLRSPEEWRDRLVWENPDFHVSHQGNEAEPTLLGDLIVQTRRHVPDLGELTRSEARMLGLLVAGLSRSLTECTGASWTYCFAFLEGYRHVHLSIVARYPGLPKEFVRLAVAEWPDAPRGSRAEVKELCRRLRKALGSLEPPFGDVPRSA
jgi:histidine triad (HIT) family protein